MSSSNYIHNFPPKGSIITFENEEEYIAKGIEWKLFTERTVKKEFLYKANGLQMMVKLVGYEEYGKNGKTIVVEFENGSLSCIHPAYLKEMQSTSFGKDLLSGENTMITPTIVETNAPKPKEKALLEKKSNKSKQTKEPAQPKMTLPEDKVHFTAKVKEFTKKMNHFTGEEDEVIVLELVQVHGEIELDVGNAWCSYSKTLKKVELEEGDVLSFDGKIVEKKFNKEIKYKINNPSKLAKIEKE